MFRRLITSVLAAAALAGAGAPARADVPENMPPLSEGVWRNPKDSVHVALKPCGSGLCGFVVWASEKAKAAARKAGNETLVGMQLLRDFVPVKAGSWKGKVYVPDLDATFSGTAEQVSANSLKAKGCLVAGLICKSQVWTRIPAEG
jgi:uncharacterized protein (DUF2147 family)